MNFTKCFSITHKKNYTDRKNVQLPMVRSAIKFKCDTYNRLTKAKAKRASWPYHVGMMLSFNVITTL